MELLSDFFQFIFQEVPEFYDEESEEDLTVEHINPQSESEEEFVDEPYNLTYLPRSENSSKGSRAPYPGEFLRSSNPPMGIKDADLNSYNGYKTSRNKDRGFGGIPRLRLW